LLNLTLSLQAAPNRGPGPRPPMRVPAQARVFGITPGPPDVSPTADTRCVG